MANSIAPSFVQIRYQSAYGLHTATVPTREYTPGITPDILGTFPRWSDDAPVDADDMIQFLVDALADGFHTTATIIDATIFNQPDPDLPATPTGFLLLGEVGTNASTAWRKANQMTLTFRTTLYGTAKLVTLDTPHSSYDRFVAGDAAAWVAALAGVFMNTAYAWSGRDGGRPAQWLQGTVTLNERLRRAYKMT